MNKTQRNKIYIRWVNWINQQDFLQDLEPDKQKLLAEFFLNELNKLYEEKTNN